MERTNHHQTCTAFAGSRRIATGDLGEVALKTKAWLDGGDLSTVLVFDDATSEPIELDLRGTADDVLRRLPQPAKGAEAGSVAISQNGENGDAPRSPGRPKLGVVAREVTLLPRHWEWLGSQPGGASVTLRKLVEAARRSNAEGDRLRQRREATYRFMSALAGNEAGFEEATRALFAGDRKGFERSLVSWPADVRDHARKLAAEAFPA